MKANENFQVISNVPLEGCEGLYQQILFMAKNRTIQMLTLMHSMQNSHFKALLEALSCHFHILMRKADPVYFRCEYPHSRVFSNPPASPNPSR